MGTSTALDALLLVVLLSVVLAGWLGSWLARLPAADCPPMSASRPWLLHSRRP